MALHWLKLSHPERIRLLAGAAAGIAISLLVVGLGQLEAGRGLKASESSLLLLGWPQASWGDS